MSGLPSIAPRLVIHASDVEEMLGGLAAEQATLRDQLDQLLAELATVGDEPEEGWDLDGPEVRSARASIGELCAMRREAALGGIAARVEAGEQAAAARVSAAEAEVAAMLAAVRIEVGDRLIGEVGEDAPVVLAAAIDDVVDDAPAVLPPALAVETAEATADDDASADAGWDDQETDTDRFRAFWSEQDEIASAREAITAPLIAIAPMASALFVIVAVLLLIV